MKRTITAVLTALFVLQSVHTGSALDPTFERIKANDDTLTSIKASESVNSNTYVFASVNEFSDSLSSYNVVKRFGAKLILIPNNESKIKNMKHPDSTAYIVGGSRTISPSIEKTLKENFKSVKRISGSNRYETNKQSLSVLNPKYIGIASGEVYPDALASTGYLNEHDLGLLLIRKNENYRGSYKPLVTFGGTNTIRHAKGLRLAGRNRYETAYKINNELNPSNIVLASGKKFTDALSGLNLVVAHPYTSIMLGDNGTYNPETIKILKVVDKIYLMGDLEQPNLNPVSTKPIQKPIPSKPNNVSKNLVTTLDKINRGLDVSKSEISAISNNKYAKALLENIGYEIVLDELRTIEYVNIPSEPYNKAKAQREYALVRKTIEDTKIDKSMPIDEIVNRLGTYFTTNSDLKYSLRIPYERSTTNPSVVSPYAPANVGKSNCMGYTFLLNQIMLELKVPTVYLRGRVTNGSHANGGIMMDGKLTQITLQIMGGFVPTEKIMLKPQMYDDGVLYSIKSNDGNGYIWKDDIYIYKLEESESTYIDRLRGIENLYNAMN